MLEEFVLLIPALVLLFASVAAATPAPVDATELLRRSDVAERAPESFRARFRIVDLSGQSDPLEVEVWRSGESRSLVRFLGPKETGRYLLKLDGEVWFLAPGARKPVKMSRAHRLRGGASLDDILGTHFGRDYVIEGATQTEENGVPVVVLDLEARSARSPYPKVRYFVSRTTERPVRVEHLLRSGKTSTVVEFLDWEKGSRPVPKRLLLTDRLRSGLRTEVTLLEMEECAVPGALFDLQDSTERKRLEDRPPAADP